MSDRVAHEVLASERLDRVLLPWCGSRRRAREAVTSGKVRVDGRVVADPGVMLRVGQRVEIWWSAPGSGVDRRRGLEVLTEAGVRIVDWRDDVVVCDKPPGLLTDAATVAQRRELPSLVGLLRRPSAPLHPFAAHRLDRDTSGLVLVARGEAAHEALRAEFAAHRPERRYLALLNGELRGDGGRWEDPMVWDAGARLQRSPRPGEDAVLAWADYRVLARGRGVTLVEVSLGTGRRNQIRLHAMLRGHPLVGERLYVGRGADRVRAPRQWLHAVALCVRLPDGSAGSWTSPVPADLRGVARGLGVGDGVGAV